MIPQTARKSIYDALRAADYKLESIRTLATEDQHETVRLIDLTQKNITTALVAVPYAVLTDENVADSTLRVANYQLESAKSFVKANMPKETIRLVERAQTNIASASMLLVSKFSSEPSVDVSYDASTDRITVAFDARWVHETKVNDQVALLYGTKTHENEALRPMGFDLKGIRRLLSQSGVPEPMVDAFFQKITRR